MKENIELNVDPFLTWYYEYAFSVEHKVIRYIKSNILKSVWFKRRLLCKPQYNFKITLRTKTEKFVCGVPRGINPYRLNILKYTCKKMLEQLQAFFNINLS